MNSTLELMYVSMDSDGRPKALIMFRIFILESKLILKANTFRVNTDKLDLVFLDIMNFV